MPLTAVMAAAVAHPTGPHYAFCAGILTVTAQIETGVTSENGTKIKTYLDAVPVMYTPHLSASLACTAKPLVYNVVASPAALLARQLSAGPRSRVVVLSASSACRAPPAAPLSCRLSHAVRLC